VDSTACGAADEDAGYRDSDEESDGEAYDVGMEDAFLEYAVGVGMSFSATMAIVKSRKVLIFVRSVFFRACSYLVASLLRLKMHHIFSIIFRRRLHLFFHCSPFYLSSPPIS
jgi:hypothetical protein